MVPQGPGLAGVQESLAWRVVSAGVAIPLVLLIVCLGSPWLTAVVGVVLFILIVKLLYNPYAFFPSEGRPRMHGRLPGGLMSTPSRFVSLPGTRP